MSIIIRSLLILVFVVVSACTSQHTRDVEENEAASGKAASATNLQLAVGYIKRGQYEVAEKKLLKAIEYNSKNIEAYTVMAFLLTTQGRNDEAEDYYTDALDITGNNPELHNSYGTFLCKVERVDEALEQFKIAYTNPFYNTQYLAYSNAGTCLMQMGEYVKAESYLRKALKKEPEHSNSLITMAEIGIKTEQYLMARAYIQRYHAVQQFSAESLWIQVQAEKALGAREHYLKYAKIILQDFPDSQEAEWVGDLARDERNNSN